MTNCKYIYSLIRTYTRVIQINYLKGNNKICNMEIHQYLKQIFFIIYNLYFSALIVNFMTHKSVSKLEIILN